MRARRSCSVRFFPLLLFKQLTKVTEEWHSYILTLGLAPVLEISSAPSPTAAFALARRNGWTRWTPPTDSAAGAPLATRRRFLQDAVARVYEERICEAFAPTARAGAGLSVRRRRRESFAEELRRSKAQRRSLPPTLTTAWPRSGTGGEDEVLMSRANTVLESLGSPRVSLQQSPAVLSPLSAFEPAFEHTLPPTPAVPAALLAGPVLWDHNAYPPAMTQLSPPSPPLSAGQISTPRLSHGGESATPSPLPSPPLPASLRMPRGPPPYAPRNQHALQLEMGAEADPAVNSSDKAIFRIVEMGFTCEEAKGALRITDLGDGLRVDRAVEYLLRMQTA